MHTTKFIQLLSAETRKDIKEVPIQEWIKFTNGLKKAGQKRKKYLIA